MHVQLKTPDGPPDNLCAKIGGILVHDDFKAKLRNGKWIYESSRHTDVSLAIPAWIDRSTVTMSVHDEEIYANGVSHVVCATTGRPLVPYYVPVQHTMGAPDACFSLGGFFKTLAHTRVSIPDPCAGARVAGRPFLTARVFQNACKPFPKLFPEQLREQLPEQLPRHFPVRHQQ